MAEEQLAISPEKKTAIRHDVLRLLRWSGPELRDPFSYTGRLCRSFRELESLIAMWVTIEYFPEKLPELEKILKPHLDLFDEVLATMDVNDQTDMKQFYRELETKLFALAERRHWKDGIAKLKDKGTQ